MHFSTSAYNNVHIGQDHMHECYKHIVIFQLAKAVQLAKYEQYHEKSMFDLFRTIFRFPLS